MTEIVATLNSKGQITVPAAVRRRLGLKANDRLVFEVEAGNEPDTPVRLTLKDVYRSVPPLAEPMDIDEMIRVAKEERVERYARKFLG